MPLLVAVLARTPDESSGGGPGQGVVTRRNDTRHQNRSEQDEMLWWRPSPMSQTRLDARGQASGRCQTSEQDQSLGGATFARLADEPLQVSVLADALERRVVRPGLAKQVHREQPVQLLRQKVLSDRSV